LLAFWLRVIEVIDVIGTFRSAISQPGRQGISEASQTSL
jgi:hypothetical protein